MITVDLSEGRWVRCRTVWTLADRRALIIDQQRRDADAVLDGIFQLTRLITEWNFTDEQGQDVAVSPDVVLSLLSEHEAGIIAKAIRERVAEGMRT